MTLPPFALSLFGPLRVSVHGAPLPRVRTRSVEWLLALLVVRHGRAVNRPWLAGTLWPESSDSQALHNLRDDLLRLRKALGPEGGRIQSPTRESLTLDLAGADVDLLQFDAALQAGDEAGLRRAVALYTGPLLDGCQEEWAFGERAARAEQCLGALDTLAEQAAVRGEHEAAIHYLRRAEALDPLRDSLTRRLMRSLAAASDPGAAIETYRDFRQRLQAELAVEPDEATTRLFHEIRAAARRPAAQRPLAPSSVAHAPPAAPPGSDALLAAPPVGEPPPRPLTALIGRDQDLAELQAALAHSRLVTLVGGGGVGKTRLALEVALQADAAGAGGAAWVELGPLADGALVLPTVAAALGVRDEGTGGAAALVGRLVGRLAEAAPLLVLDNCEHLLDAVAGEVRRLLERCPGLRVLATSRQRLGLPGELTWRVPSLALPPAEGVRRQMSGGGASPRAEAVTGVGSAPSDRSARSRAAPDAQRPSPEHLMQYAAVRLFVERAAAARPGFRLASDTEAAAVGQICRRLDGIPLALELAAARAGVLTPPQIAARLDDRFRLLTGGSRGALPRHQTLRALIDWSYDSLPAAEAVLLRQLSVFAGGWTLEAAEAICSDFGLGPDPSAIQNPKSKIQNPEVLDLLDSLVDRSLVLVHEVDGGLRYRLLETVREYAREKLEAAGEGAAVRNRHRDWYLQLAEQVEAEILASGREAALRARLETELDNLRAALAWCQEAADADPGGEAAGAGLRLANALGEWWYSRGHLAEGQRWLEGALARGPEAPARLRATALLLTAHLAYGRDPDWQALMSAARRELERALEQARRAGDRRQIARALVSLAEVAFRTDELDETWKACAEARQLFEESSDLLGLAETLEWLGGVALRRKDHQAARSVLEERLAICRKLGGSELLIPALGGLGHLERAEGHYDRARALYQESLDLRRELGHQMALAQALEDFAGLAGREQQAERAIRLLGAAEAFCETFGARPPVAIVEEYERTVAEGRAALGEVAFAAAWADGRAMSLDEAVEYAMDEGGEPLE